MSIRYKQNPDVANGYIRLGKRMKIVFASHTARTDIFRIGSHHYSRELAVLGHEVTHITTPLSLGHVLRIGDRSIRRRIKIAIARDRYVIDGVSHIVPITLLPVTKVPSRLVSIMLKLPVLPWAFKVARNPDVLIIDQPLLHGLVDILAPKVVVYRPTDTHSAGIAFSAEMHTVTKANRVVGTSQHVIDSLTTLKDDVPRMVLENGVDFKAFANSENTNHSVRRGAIYVGALDNRFDWEAVNDMARDFPEEPFILAGPVVSSKVPPLEKNIELLGPIEYENLPNLLGSAKVGLLPFSEASVNQGRSPMKYYEYLAAGLYIIGSETPALRSRRAEGVYLYSNRTEIPFALKKAFSKTSENLAGRQEAEGYSWTSRTKSLLEFIVGDS
ncbi:glycosyltransferase family protein [Arthrobacter sp. TMT4-20]